MNPELSGLLAVLAGVFVFVVILVLGVRFGSKSRSRPLKYSLLAVWVIGSIVLFSQAGALSLLAYFSVLAGLTFIYGVSTGIR